MKRKIKIPEMDRKDIVKWYATIKPIVRENGKFMYLRKLKDKEVLNAHYTELRQVEDYAGRVDFSLLSVLADVKMLHGFSRDSFFRPSVGEVISQIPKDMLEKVVAFEIIYAPTTSDDFNIFKREFEAGFHVSVVRLYQAKNNHNEVARSIASYPTKNSKLPIGMTEKKFNKLKELYSED